MGRLLLLFILLWSSGLQAAGKGLDLLHPHLAIGRSVSYVEDPSASLTVQQVMNLPEQRFIPLGKPTASHTFTRSALWYRFEVDNPTAEPLRRILWLDQSWLHSTNFAVVSPSGAVTLLPAGNGLPFTARAIANPKINVAHDFAPGHSTVYLQVMTADPFVVTINLADEPEFLASQLWDVALTEVVGI